MVHPTIVKDTPFNLVLFRLIGLVWGLDIVSFPDHSYVTLEVSFAAGCDVVRVRQHGPLVVKLVLCKQSEMIKQSNVN